MSSRSYAKRNSELETEQDELPIHVYLILNKDVRLKILGPVTGTQYFFKGAGARVSVDKRDADILIQKQRPNPDSCCGTKDSPYFIME